eukprot:g32967.t1
MDLNVQVHGSLKEATQVAEMIKKAYSTLAFIDWGMEYKSWQTMLYKTLVRLCLEYHAQFWSPHYQKAVEGLERMQRRVIRMLRGLNAIGYEDREVTCCIDKGNVFDVIYLDFKKAFDKVLHTKPIAK